MTESALEHAEVLKNELKLIGAVDTDGVSVLSDDKLVKRVEEIVTRKQKVREMTC